MVDDRGRLVPDLPTPCGHATLDVFLFTSSEWSRRTYSAQLVETPNVERRLTPDTHVAAPYVPDVR